MDILPEKPSENDCCGSGCNPCVFDVYEKLLRNVDVGNVSPLSQSSANIRHDLLSPLKYKPFILLNVEKINKNTNIYCFKPLIIDNGNTVSEKSSESNICDDLEGVLPYRPGQHIIMTDAKACSGISNYEFISSSISRAYTPVSVAKKEKNCRLKLLIKLYADGAMSAFIRQWPINAVVLFRGPFGDFNHVPNSRYLMLCAGTGFAPMYPIIESVIVNEDDETMIRLCYACCTLDGVFFREKIRQFSRYWNFEAHIYLSNVSDNQLTKNVFHDENIYGQKITLRALKERIFPVKYRVLICGSDSFNADMKTFVELCGCDDIFIF